jgi:putative membrane protein
VEFIIHIIVTAIALIVISKLLRGFEIDSWLTAVVTAVILGLLHALMSPFAEKLGGIVGGILAATALAYPAKIALFVLSMLAINALVLKFAAAIGPGFRISNFTTAILAALLLAVFNLVIGEVISFAGAYLNG